MTIVVKLIHAWQTMGDVLRDLKVTMSTSTLSMHHALTRMRWSEEAGPQEQTVQECARGQSEQAYRSGGSPGAVYAE